MDVDLRVEGALVVEDAGDEGNVEAAGGDVGADEDGTVASGGA